MANQHDLHDGERFLQTARGTPIELTAAMPAYIERDMPPQHAEFFAGLPYLPLATLDHLGRPWASIFVTESERDGEVGINIPGRNRIDLVAETNPHDPFVRALKQNEISKGAANPLFAGVGVDFSNRRRNKIAGSISSFAHETDRKVRLQLHSDQHLGNCPKYITVRSLEHHARQADLVFQSVDSLTSPLPDVAKSLIDQASTGFLATKHTSGDGQGASDDQDMGLNHRGGAPGFIRLYEESDGGIVTTYLVLPDHSGNRFYQSLGNIETDKQVGLVLPDFSTGDVLYITGNAQNLRDAKAEALMPRTSLLTRIEVTGVVFVKEGLNLKLASEEEYSPYNPPVKYLRSELESMGRAPSAFGASEPIIAALVSTKRMSNTITTFTFELSTKIDAPLPGGFGIFDFSNVLDAGYRHMSEANPQLVNEDFVRTWTLSNASIFDAETEAFLPTNRVSITVKREPGGLMSNFLHDHADELIARQVPIIFKGVGASFSCFTPNDINQAPSVPQKMLWIAGGVGITPFMSMWDSLISVAKAVPNSVSSDIIVLFSGRGDDVRAAQHFLSTTQSIPEQIKLRLVAFQSSGGSASASQAAREALSKSGSNIPIEIEQGRVRASDLAAIEDLSDREVFMCGPDPFLKWAHATLEALNIDPSQIHQETFAF